MKRIAPAFIALGLLALAGCTDANPGLTVLGAVPLADDGSGGCSSDSAAGTTDFQGSQVVNVLAMKQAPPAGLGTLSRFLGLNVSNNLATVAINAPGGTQANTDNQQDVIVDSVDVQALDLNGGTVASETLLANAYIKAGGTATVAFDYLAKPLAEALSGKTDPFDMILVVTLHGHTAANQHLDTAEFRFPVHVRYDDPTQVVALPDGGASALAGAGLCK